MSGGLSAAFAAAGFVSNLLSSPSPARVILYQAVDAQGNLVTDNSGNPVLQAFDRYVPIREQHHDQMVITEHPVEQGAVITDHAYKLPSQPRFRFGWSPAGAAAASNISIGGAITLPTFSGLWAGDDSASYLSGLYAQFLNLMVTRSLLTIITGKRTYSNLLVLSVDEVTDETTEYSLMLDISCKEVILVSTSTVKVPLNTAANANPQTATPTVNSGAKQLQPGNNFNPAAAPAQQPFGGV